MLLLLVVVVSLVVVVVVVDVVGGGCHRDGTVVVELAGGLMLWWLALLSLLILACSPFAVVPLDRQFVGKPWTDPSSPLSAFATPLRLSPPACVGCTHVTAGEARTALREHHS